MAQAVAVTGLPRTRSFRRTRPQGTWWLAVGIALAVNLAVVLALSQVSRLHAAPLEVPLAVRTLRQVDQELPPPPPPPERLREPQESPVETTVPVAVPLPSFDLPASSSVGGFALPALGSLDAGLDLPASIPAFTVAAPVVVPAPVVATSTPGVDTPAQREGAFDLDRHYPRSARIRGITGTSKIRLGIDAAGSVIVCTVLDSSPAGVFDQAAERLGRSLRFRPALAGGVPVASTLDTTIQWTMK